ncbi:MAG: glycerol-3-phosphate 1-O-acyltransferase PlsY [Acidimicrobiia bacterium]|nr:glycerol-3-phosphate 1-O-acyltransferase PlsY [Acidimicrobiia bacterium]
MAGSCTVPALLIAFSYVLGTFPSAILIAKANGIDISSFGSGNPGASNVTRALGWRKGVWVYALDALKGAIPAALALAVDGRPLAYWCGAAAILGHMFPVFRKFRGGKGVATGSGVLVVLFPLLFVVAVATWWVITKLTGKAAIGSIAAAVLVPIGLAVSGAPAWEFIAVLLLSGLVALRHAGNVARMVRREEHTLGEK